MAKRHRNPKAWNPGLEDFPFAWTDLAEVGRNWKYILHRLLYMHHEALGLADFLEKVSNVLQGYGARKLTEKDMAVLDAAIDRFQRDFADVQEGVQDVMPFMLRMRDWVKRVAE